MYEGGFRRWLRTLTRPRALLLGAAILACACVAGVHGWAWLHLAYGERSLAKFENESARKHLQQCLRLWPHSAVAHLLAARAERRAGQFLAAQQHLDQCRKSADGTVADEAGLEWALQRAAAGDLRTVEESLQARILSRPQEAALIWEALSEGYRRNYRMPEALHCLDTWLHFEPANAQVYFLRGELHREVGAVNRARDEYARVLELDSHRVDARRQLVNSLVQIGHYQEALDQLQIVLRTYPGDPALLTLAARSHYDLGEREEAARLLDQLLTQHPDYGPALRERGRMALIAEQYGEAEQWLRRALVVLPYSYEVNWDLSQALRGEGKTAEAKAQIAVASELKNRRERVHEIQTHQMTLTPADPALHAELGELLIEMGQQDNGEYWLQSALQIDPQLTAAHSALARLYAARGDADQAQSHQRAAERLRVGQN